MNWHFQLNLVAFPPAPLFQRGEHLVKLLFPDLWPGAGLGCFSTTPFKEVWLVIWGDKASFLPHPPLRQNPGGCAVAYSPYCLFQTMYGLFEKLLFYEEIV